MGRLLCWFWLHDWRYFHTPPDEDRRICEHCGKVSLKFWAGEYGKSRSWWVTRP